MPQYSSHTFLINPLGACRTWKARQIKFWRAFIRPTLRWNVRCTSSVGRPSLKIPLTGC